MENIPEDNFTREIIARSRLELMSPDFDEKVMKNIIHTEVNKNLIRNIILYPVVILTIEAFIFLTIRSMHIRISDLTFVLQSFPGIILFYFDIITKWIIAKGYVVLPVIVILFIKLIMDSRLRYL
jgi:hypothetical protein